MLSISGRKVLPETVRRCALDTGPGRGDGALDGGVQSPSKFLLFGFDTLDDGDREQFFVDAAVEAEYSAHFFAAVWPSCHRNSRVRKNAVAAVSFEVISVITMMCMHADT